MFKEVKDKLEDAKFRIQHDEELKCALKVVAIIGISSIALKAAERAMRDPNKLYETSHYYEDGQRVARYD